MATPDIKWLPKHMSATLQSGDITQSSVTPSPGSVVGAQPGFLLKAKSTLFTKSHLEQLTLPLNSRKLWTWVFVSILLRTH